METALTKFWMGNTSESAVMACSLICATNRLSTMLYRELTSIEMTLGNAIDSSSGKTGRVFIKVSFTVVRGSFACSEKCGFGAQKSHTTALLGTIVWRKIANTVKIHTVF